MGETGNGTAGNAVLALGERVRDVNRALNQACAAGNPDGIRGPADVCRVLGSLELLVGNLSRTLPELGEWLEQQMWSGRLGGAGDSAALDELTAYLFRVTGAIARGQAACAQLSYELKTAQAAGERLAATP